MAISEFPKWRKYLILLSFLDNSSARPVQIGGVDVNICHSRSTAVRGRRRSSSQSPPRGPFCRTRTGPVEADGAVDAQNAPTAPWKTLCVFHELPQGLSHQVTHEKLAISEFPKWRKYLILLSFLDNSSARPVQIGGVDVNICHSRSTAVRGRRRSSSQSPPRGPFCRTRTGPVEADGAVDAQNAPTAPWKTLCVFHELPQGLSHQVTHEKLRKAPKYRWETRIDPKNSERPLNIVGKPG